MNTSNSTKWDQLSAYVNDGSEQADLLGDKEHFGLAQNGQHDVKQVVERELGEQIGQVQVEYIVAELVLWVQIDGNVSQLVFENQVEALQRHGWNGIVGQFVCVALQSASHFSRVFH